MTGRVVQVDACRLHLTGELWPFARENAPAIDSHWRARKLSNPSYFNGVIHVMTDGGIEHGVFSAIFRRTDFKSFLYWRESGYPAAGAYDAFGSALLRSVEGHVLLGRQSAGNINAGLAYLPGGFIDARDVGPDGAIDIACSIRRELAEETGLDGTTLVQRPGFLVTRIGPLVSMAAEFRSPLPSLALRDQILGHLAASPDPELADIVVVRAHADLEGAGVPPYTALVVRHVLNV